MRKADAPPAGWYPDPTGGPRLRWWDGLDWTEHRRVPPPSGQTALEAAREAGREAASRMAAQRDEGDAGHRRESTGSSAGWSRRETADLVSEVRRATRHELERATTALGQQAREATSRLEPLIGEYSGRVVRWLKIAVVVAIAVGIAWVLLQTFGQASLLNWLGERVDSLLSGTSPARAAVSAAAAGWWP